MEPGESAEEFKEKVDEVKEGGHVEEETKDEGDDEDDERKKASELWKMNLNK